MTPKRTSDSATSIIQADSLVDRSFGLLHKSILFGWKKELYRSAALYNLKTFSPDFSSVTKDLHISDTSAKRLIRVGKRLAQIIHSEENEVSFISEEDLETICSKCITNGERITLRGLDKATREFDLFTKYLSGEIEEAILLGTPISAGELPAHIIEETEDFVTNEKAWQEPLVEKAPRERVIKQHVLSDTSYSPQASSVWDELENIIIGIPEVLIETIRNASVSHANDKKALNKFKSISGTLNRIHSAIAAYHRDEVKEAMELLSTEEMEEV